MRTIYFPLYIIRPFERGIVEHLGKYQKFVEPGFHLQRPFVSVTRVRDVREHTMSIEPQHVITKDNVEIRVDGLIWVRPGLSTEEIQKTFYRIDDRVAAGNVRNQYRNAGVGRFGGTLSGAYRCRRLRRDV